METQCRQRAQEGRLPAGIGAAQVHLSRRTGQQRQGRPDRHAGGPLDRWAAGCAAGTDRRPVRRGARRPRIVMATTVPVNPYPGLRPFHEDEQYLYFGREAAVDAMVDRLKGRRFLAVLGTSGSGKSSLVNCGLRPALHRGLMADAGSAWRIAVCRPGGDPIASLAQSLDRRGVLFDMPGQDSGSPGFLPRASLIEATLRMSGLGLIDIVEQARLAAGVNLLVIVDQFEELFRYRGLATSAAAEATRGEDDAAAFVNLLLHASSQSAVPIFVVLSMRSDFLGDCTRYPGLAEAIKEGKYL